MCNCVISEEKISVAARKVEHSMQNTEQCMHGIQEIQASHKAPGSFARWKTIDICVVACNYNNICSPIQFVAIHMQIISI